jgi:precorrin-6B methylase 2
MNLIRKIFNHISWRINYISAITIPQTFFSLFIPKVVLHGPFKGMKYINRSTGSVILPKLIGTYEDELHNIFYSLKKNSYQRFIDIGAAEGYYAVGIKKYLLPDTCEAIAFEANLKGRRLIKKLAKCNGVEDIQVLGFCTLAELKKTLNDERTLLIVDIEGGEYDMLVPAQVNFARCDILVEVHPINEEKKEITLINRFRDTHNITRIEQKAKQLPDIPQLRSFLKKYDNYLINEFRGEQSWLFLESKYFPVVS